MTAKKLYHRLYARVVRARLRWSVQPPVFFARRRYWLTSVVAVVVLIGAAVSVLAWCSHEERVNRERDNEALAGATSVVNAYCDAILKGNVDEAAAMDGLADSTDPNWMLSDAGEDFTVAAGTFVSLSVSEGEMSPDRLTATFDVTSTPRVGMAAREESIEMVARRDSVDAPWRIATSLAQTVTVELPGATTDVLFNGATIASFNPVAEWPVKGRALTLTLYPGKYDIGARSFSSEARLRSLARSSPNSLFCPRVPVPSRSLPSPSTLPSWKRKQNSSSWSSSRSVSTRREAHRTCAPTRPQTPHRESSRLTFVTSSTTTAFV